jgi:hypothetical protein
MLLNTNVCDVCLQNNAGYTGKYLFLYLMVLLRFLFLAVMMAAVIDITNNEQREIVRRLFRESGNVNVKTIDVCFRRIFIEINVFFIE